MDAATTHPDDTCTPEHLCDQCAWAEFQQAEDVRLNQSQARIALPTRIEYLRCGECGQFEPCSCATVSPFNAVWDSAPRSRQRLTTRSDAEYWFLRGRQWGMAEALAQSNSDMRQLLKGDVDENRT